MTDFCTTHHVNVEILLATDFSMGAVIRLSLLVQLYNAPIIAPLA